jgi:hypothetical protein
MEEIWIADRTALRHLLHLHPTWTHAQFADCLHRSRSWVKKWRNRLSQADPNEPPRRLWAVACSPSSCSCNG